ncbi:MAG: hypothetical protein ACXABY_26535 [Candidatus Thorarchaeota archaeon]|jgi:hypothetical protein
MKTVKIGTVLKTFAGKEMTDAQKEGEDKNVLVKDILVQYVGQLFENENKERVLLAYRVAQKIYDCEDEEIDLEDAEFKLILEATSKPKMGHSPLIMGPIYEVLEEAEEAAKKKKQRERPK